MWKKRQKKTMLNIKIQRKVYFSLFCNKAALQSWKHDGRKTTKKKIDKTTQREENFKHSKSNLNSRRKTTSKAAN